ncbi:hypothetical protein BD408DRAFT_432929 [Parasitella parasitica]|nr:hypothetical protein BD408DRAFT_432929 [Parasitella parasitica]
MKIWDELKEEIKTFTRFLQLVRESWRHKSINKLQSKRNRIVRDYKNTGILSLLLPSLEALLGKLQEEQARDWCAQGSARFLPCTTRKPAPSQPLMMTRDVQRDLSPEQQTALLAPIEIEEIIGLSGRASRTSSPGVDGLSYGILRLF